MWKLLVVGLLSLSALSEGELSSGDFIDFIYLTATLVKCLNSAYRQPTCFHNPVPVC